MPHIVIAIAVMVLPFVLLYEAVGPVWFWIILIIVGAGLVYWWSIFSKRVEEGHRLARELDEAEFNELVLRTITSRMHWKEAQSINRSLFRVNHSRAALIRKLQIIRESIDIALASKKRDVAESRMKSVLELFSAVKDEGSGLTNGATMTTIEGIVVEAYGRFQTDIYLNIAQGHLEKAAKLKTAKARLKYIQMAKHILVEGMDDPKSKKQALEDMLQAAQDTESAIS